MLFGPALAGKEKSIDRIFIQTAVYIGPITIGAFGAVFAGYRRRPPPGAVSTRDYPAVRSRGRWAGPMAERAWVESRRDRRNHPGSLPSPYWQEEEGSASRRWARVGEGSRAASRATWRRQGDQCCQQ